MCRVCKNCYHFACLEDRGYNVCRLAVYSTVKVDAYDPACPFFYRRLTEINGYFSSREVKNG